MTNRTRVLQVGPLPPPVGGMASVVTNLMQDLGARSRYEVRLLNNAKTTRADRPLWRGIVSQLALLARLATICASWRPDIVHVHTCSEFSFWRNSLDVVIARMLGCHVVLHIHGGKFADFLASMGLIHARLALATFRLTHRVLILGEFARPALESWAGAAHVVVLPNGVAIEEPVQFRDRSDFHIACLANYGAQKGQEDLLYAVARLRQREHVHVRFAGVESTLGDRARLEGLAASLGLADHVSVDGPIVGHAKEVWLRQVDCFCLPSYFEALPMAMLEAMAIGLPVVVTRVGAIPSTVVDATEGLLFSPGNLTELTSHLQYLMDYPARRQSIGLEGRRRIARDYSLIKSGDRLQQVYEFLAT
jgi:glycosyltransferase involved in cell wall biosynthesis